MVTGFEEALFTDTRICQLAESDRSFACEMYSALSNIIWESESGDEFAASWRYAAGIAADLANKNETYLDYYCMGNEGVVSERVERELKRLGWTWKEYSPSDSDDLQ